MMSKFCNECGAILFDENAAFCSFCGAKVIQEEGSLTGRTPQPAQKNIGEETKTLIWNSRSRAILSIISILSGISILIVLFFVPVLARGQLVEVEGLSGIITGTLSKSMTIVEMQHYCPKSIFSGNFDTVCSQTSWYFTIGLILSILFIIAGIYGVYHSKKY